MVGDMVAVTGDMVVVTGVMVVVTGEDLVVGGEVMVRAMGITIIMAIGEEDGEVTLGSRSIQNQVSDNEW